MSSTHPGRGDGPPVVERIGGTPAELSQARAAGALTALGLVPGDRVAFVLGSSADLLCAVLGALRVGIVPVMLNPTLTDAERDFILVDCQPSLTVDSPGALDQLMEAPGVELAPWPLARPMHYTSGTTGRPKGVWSGVLGHDQARRMADDEADLWAFEGSDALLVASPLHHSAPLRFSAGVLARGGDVVVMERFEAATVVQVLAEHAITSAFVVPAHLQRLLAPGPDGACPLDGADLSRFRLLAHAGAACPEPVKRAVIDRFPGDTVWEFYGSTEGQFTACSSAEWLERPGTVGRARPGRRLEVDGSGVIWCAPPEFGDFSYWNDPARTASAWSVGADGRRQFTVGDLGRLDGDGYLYLDGRRDDLIISGGVNVYPAEVEGALAAVEGVVEVAVFGVDDERWGQRVCAAVIGSADPEKLRQRAREVLAPYKRPKEILLVEELPRTSTGKIRRTAIAVSLGLAQEVETVSEPEMEAR